jgi:hypothetical protein
MIDEQNKNNDLETSEQTLLPQAENEDKANDYLRLISLIKSNISLIDRLKEQAKEQKEMLESILDNDLVYQEHFEKAKEATRIKNETKKQLLSQPAAIQTSEKIKSLKENLKDAQESLSAYLKQFQETTEETQIEGDDGQIREIISILKLVKKSNKYNP